jgi:hypothetical protein
LLATVPARQRAIHPARTFLRRGSPRPKPNQTTTDETDSGGT